MVPSSNTQLDNKTNGLFSVLYLEDDTLSIYIRHMNRIIKLLDLSTCILILVLNRVPDDKSFFYFMILLFLSIP